MGRFCANGGKCDNRHACTCPNGFTGPQCMSNSAAVGAGVCTEALQCRGMCAAQRRCRIACATSKNWERELEMT
jgi:hypothetical protein